MLNSIYYSCVKYANNYRINNSTTGGNISTKTTSRSYMSSSYVCKTILYGFHLPPLSTIISTYINTIYNLLNKSFTHYPQHLLLELLKEN